MSGYPHMKNPIRLVALFYNVAIVLAAIWALYVDVTMLHSGREHLLPDVALVVLAWPSSRSLGPLYDAWPQWFSAPFVQLGWTAVCGAFQAAILWLLAWIVARYGRRARGPLDPS